MTVAARLTAMQDRVIHHFGGGSTVTLRRRHSLKDKVKGKPISALLVHGNQSSGAALVNLRATGLEGKAVKGIRFTIAGHAQVYTATGNSEASAGLIAVGISPVLQQNILDGAAVTITQGYADYTFRRMRSEAVEQELGAGIQGARRAFHLSALAAAVTPDPETDLIIDGAEGNPILAVRPVDAGGGATRWTVILGDA